MCHSSQADWAWWYPHPSLQESLEHRLKFLPSEELRWACAAKPRTVAKKWHSESHGSQDVSENYRVFTLSLDNFPSLFFGKEKIFVRREFSAACLTTIVLIRMICPVSHVDFYLFLKSQAVESGWAECRRKSGNAILIILYHFLFSSRKQFLF